MIKKSILFEHNFNQLFISLDVNFINPISQ